MSKRVYPISCYIRTITTDTRGEIPAFAPNAHEDPMVAYAAFLNESEDALRREIYEDSMSEEAFDTDECYPCVVHESGRLEFAGRDMTREEVFACYYSAENNPLPGM